MRQQSGTLAKTHKRIFDCFMFFNEFELLELRLKELYDVVDYFVICEATQTFQGQIKAAYFAVEKFRFEHYLDKIIHIIVDDMPPSVGDEREENFWRRERFQRNAIRRGIACARPDDIIIISDCDELISRNTIDYLRHNEGYFLLDMPMYQFYFNMRERASGWTAVFAFSYYLTDRIIDFTFPRSHSREAFATFSEENHFVENAGWHFTFLGGAALVRQKLRAYSHTDGWQRELLDDSALEFQMLELRAVGGENGLEFCEIDHTFPGSLIQNAAHFVDAGFIITAHSRLRDLEKLALRYNNKYKLKVIEFENLVSAYRSLQERVRDVWEKLPASESFLPAEVVNYLPSSSDFSAQWCAGRQSKAATICNQNIPLVMSGNLVMCHFRDGDRLTVATDTGGYCVRQLAPGRVYTISCWVWIPDEFNGSSVYLSIGNLNDENKTFADLRNRSCWQRIASTAIVRSLGYECHGILHVESESEVMVYTTCWQLEAGRTPTAYRATAPINLLPASVSFGAQWSRGMQKSIPIPTAEVPPFIDNNAIMCHVREPEVTPDTNVGYYRSDSVLPHHFYTGSCWVWIPEKFDGRDIYLAVGEWGTEITTHAQLAMRNVWQRISTTSRAPTGIDHCNVILRVTADTRCEVYSTCWQLEEGDRPSHYQP